MNISDTKLIKAGQNVASIDIGSHTARILIAQCTGSADLFHPLFRKEEYTSLGNDFVDDSKRSISEKAIERVLKVLGEFAAYSENYNIEDTWAVSTGVFRKADNSNYLLGLIKEQIGFDVERITGEREALLTRMGILHSLDFGEKSQVIFDLGGATTEFVIEFGSKTSIESIPLGALVLTRRFFKKDPPGKNSLKKLSVYIDNVLRKTFPEEIIPGKDSIIIGSGGTATTLAAMIYGIDIEEITPDKLNGLIIESSWIRGLCDKIIGMKRKERLTLTGLDRGRADVILAGVLIIVGILNFFRFRTMIVSYSDILEGIIIEHLKGE